jgi:hypothetical protein
MRDLARKAFLIAAVCASVAAGDAAQPPSTEYSLMTAEAYPSEIDLAYRRLWHFLNHLNSKTRALLQTTPYVAIQAYQVAAGDVPFLMRRLSTGTAQAADAYSNDLRSLGEAKVKFLLVFDWRTRKLADREGVMVATTPPKGTVGLFNGLSAVYGGTG